MPVGQPLDARGTVELGPLRAQRRYGVVLAPDFGAQLGDALRLSRRFELDLVDVGRREHERGDHADVDQAHHRGRLRARCARTSASDGRRGSSAAAAPTGGAAVRSAARSLAERARGLAATSASFGTIGRLVRRRKLAAIRGASGAWREEEEEACRLRSARNDFAMRSSSEWNATTTNRPLGLSTS